MTLKFTDLEIIEAFRAGGQARESAWEFAYKEWRDKVIGVIVNRGGTKEEALEALNGAAKDFEARMRQPSFVLENKLSTFFIECVKNEWLRMMKKKKKGIEEKLEDPFSLERAFDKNMSVVTDSGEEMVRELEVIIDNTLNRIGERCKTILVLFMNGFSMQAIADRMGFPGGEQVAKNEKRKCQLKYEIFLREQPLILKHIQNLRNG